MDKYCDHGVYPRWTSVPTWGVAIEGDGTSINASAVPATVSIDLSAYTAAAGNTFVVAGATLTCVASGAAANQFNAAADAATLVANLASAINAATNAVNSAATGWYKGQLRDMVYARVNPSTPTTLDIMTRAGSATYNANSMWQVVSGGFTGGAAQVSAQFSGGVGGCWGWIQNLNTAVGQNNNVLSSQIYVYQLGVWGLYLLAGVRAPGDNIYIRANKTLLITGNGGYPQINPGPVGTQSNYVNFIVDDGTIWPADGQYPKLVFNYDCSPYSFMLAPDANCCANFLGQKYPDGSYSIQVRSTVGGNSTNWPMGAQLGGCWRARGWLWDSVTYSTTTSTGGAQLSYSGGIGQYHRSCLQDSKLVCKSMTYWMSGNYSNNPRSDLINVEFNLVGAVSPHTGLIDTANVSWVELAFYECTFTGFVTGSQLFATGRWNQGTRIIARNCKWGGVTLHGPIPAATNQYDNQYDYCSQIAISSTYGARDFSIDVKGGFCEWNSGRSFPTLSAVQLDGVTPWSILAMPSTIQNNMCASAPFMVPRLSKINTLATGVRTISVDLAIAAAISWTKRDISIQVDYQADDGTYCVEDSLDIFGGALTPSSSVWSQESGGQVTFNNGGTIYHNKYQLQLTTKKPIANGTDIGVIVRFHTPVANTTQTTFIDPEFRVA